MPLRIYFPALEGLNAAYSGSSGTIVLLSYNNGSKHTYPCGHQSDADRVYRCPPELVEAARDLKILASTVNIANVILFDRTGYYMGTGHRVTQ